ncbi:MAG: hypothetical protein E7156_01355 [Streptococcus gallolyticus]|uniref:Lipoprotein n=1 Tax=Streptococcus gallolyticus TaxID=315405 RepID=A0A928A501_9STRE|nr:hypothetical protein [Streptococcus gallolyticus]
MKKNNFKLLGIIMALLLITACSSSNQNDTQKEYTSKSSVSESSGSTLSYGSPGEAEYYPLEHSHSVPSDLDAYVGYYTGELETASHLRYKFALSINSDGTYTLSEEVTYPDNMHFESTNAMLYADNNNLIHLVKAEKTLSTGELFLDNGKITNQFASSNKLKQSFLDSNGNYLPIYRKYGDSTSEIDLKDKEVSIIVSKSPITESVTLTPQADIPTDVQYSTYQIEEYSDNVKKYNDDENYAYNSLNEFIQAVFNTVELSNDSNGNVRYTTMGISNLQFDSESQNTVVTDNTGKKLRIKYQVKGDNFSRYSYIYDGSKVYISEESDPPVDINKEPDTYLLKEIDFNLNIPLKKYFDYEVVDYEISDYS